MRDTKEVEIRDYKLGDRLEALSEKLLQSSLMDYGLVNPSTGKRGLKRSPSSSIGTQTTHGSPLKPAHKRQDDGTHREGPNAGVEQISIEAATVTDSCFMEEQFSI